MSNPILRFGPLGPPPATRPIAEWREPTAPESRTGEPLAWLKQRARWMNYHCVRNPDVQPLLSDRQDPDVTVAAFNAAYSCDRAKPPFGHFSDERPLLRALVTRREQEAQTERTRRSGGGGGRRLPETWARDKWVQHSDPRTPNERLPGTWDPEDGLLGDEALQDLAEGLVPEVVTAPPPPPAPEEGTNFAFAALGAAIGLGIDGTKGALIGLVIGYFGPKALRPKV